MAISKEKETDSSEEVKSVSKKSKIGKIIGAFFLFLIIVGLGGATFYFYDKYKKASTVEADMIIAKLGKLMVLPEGEKPTLITVTDKSMVSEQPFFAKSENGDKVLIFIQAKKAVLYRPSMNKIIEIMPLSISNTKDEKSGSDSAPETLPGTVQEDLKK